MITAVRTWVHERWLKCLLAFGRNIAEMHDGQRIMISAPPKGGRREWKLANGTFVATAKIRTLL